MGLITDLHLLICIVAFIYVFQKVRDSTQSRILGVIIGGFIVFFIFFQHIWVAFLFFVIMFGYLFLGGFTTGLVEGQMAGAYMHYLKHTPPSIFGPQIGPPGSGTGANWYKAK
ncbi:MAG: hypothetical protein JXB14_05550 [Candidatus Altiarchaeota archaeon]|nr:hypothetical protein [Candidatus Altiarchaeota archaeon]